MEPPRRGAPKTKLAFLDGARLPREWRADVLSEHRQKFECARNSPGVRPYDSRHTSFEELRSFDHFQPSLHGVCHVAAKKVYRSR
jgi:hypothetical protein